MASKKLLLLVVLFVFAQVSINAQTNWGWDWKDTSKIAVKDLPQHNEFMNNQYPYPAKPRSQWELGFNLGPSWISGDVNSNIGLAYGISARKALGHIFSVRGSLSAASNSGTPSNYGIGVGQVAYKNNMYALGVDFIASLNTPSYYRGNPKTNLYVLGGYSLVATRAQYQGAPGAQPGGYNIFYGQRLGQANTQKGLITTLGGATVNNRKSYGLMHAFNLGLGAAFKISEKVNIGIEQKFIFSAAGYDYLDAFKDVRNESNDYFSMTTARVNINIGDNSKKVQPLYWINPNNFIYSELNEPKHMKLPKVILPDADKDGVTDQFDMEPNTPAGAPVDTHGVSKDTDGDGVPDFRDKELLTSQKCFPVNNDGIGTCPENACCKEIKEMVTNMQANQKPSCTISALPSVQFKGTTTKLSKDAMVVLSAAAAQLKANPTCNVKVIGYGATSKAAQQQSWERVNAVIKYLVESQGIAESRLLFVYAQDGKAGTVDLQGTTEEGPNSVPAPHPNLKSRN
jgi:outer membrane protein OmpA-like peptidoglycan-associated protein